MCVYVCVCVCACVCVFPAGWGVKRQGTPTPTPALCVHADGGAHTWLQVPVVHPHRVAVRQGIGQLPEVGARGVLGDAVPRGVQDYIVQVAATSKLKDDEDLVERGLGGRGRGGGAGEGRRRFGEQTRGSVNNLQSFCVHPTGPERGTHPPWLC